MNTTTKLAAAATVGYLGLRTLKKRREIDLMGKVVLITGGSRGLGLVMAREFAARGCRLVICARDQQELARARRDVEQRGADVLALPCNVAHRVEVEQLVDAARERFGRIDVLVNNAGIIQVGPVETMTLEDFQQIMDVNFWGAVHATLAVLPHMRERGAGRIVNITSIGGKVAVPHLLPYSCAKFALVGFSEGLHAELAQHGIVVTTVVPGLMRTGSPVNALFKGQRAEEFTWFSIGDATPITAMSAERAARRIVEATRKGEGEVTLSWQAQLIRLAHGLFPGTTADVFGLMNRLLPAADGTGTGQSRGMELATAASPSPLTALMNRAARRNNEYGGQSPPSAEHAERAGLGER